MDACDIAIVGGGAAGLAAGIFAGEAARDTPAPHAEPHARPRPRRIAVFDGAKALGAKILVSGGGRCNVTHDRILPDDYFGAPRHIVRHVLAAFDEHAAVRWFASLGVPLKREETGKLFPVSDSARTVLNALLARATALGVELRTGQRVLGIEPVGEASEEATGEPPAPPGFVLRTSAGELRAGRVILATGGKSLPKTGSDGAGWELARALGHSVTPVFPALVPLVLDPAFFHAGLSGLSCDAELRTLAAGRVADRRTGRLLWTHFGISGPVVMDASRHWLVARAGGGAVELRCSLRPGVPFEQVEQELLAAAGRSPRQRVAAALAAWLPQRLADALAAHALGPAAVSLTLGQWSRAQRRAVAHALTDLVLPATGDRGWNYAEVTAGGVPLGEVDFRTLASRRQPGLYLAGEILDCDGRIGGYNFQWAWATGYLSGRAAAGAVTAG